MTKRKMVHPDGFTELYRATFEQLGFSLRSTDRLPEKQLDAVERRLHISIPASLRAYCRVAGREPKLNRAHSELLPPAKWTISENKLVFLEGHQGVVMWATDLSRNSDDPEVFQTADGEQWFSEHPQLSIFMAVMLHWNAVQGYEVLPCAGMADVSADVRLQLDKNCHFVGEVNKLRAYNRDRVVLCFLPWEKGPRLFVAGPSQDIVKAVFQTIGCNWERDFDQV